MGRSEHFFTPVGDLQANVRAYLLLHEGVKVLRLSTHWEVVNLPLGTLTRQDVAEGLAMALAGRPVRETLGKGETPPWLDDNDDERGMGLPERNPEWMAILDRWAREITEWVRFGAAKS